jgi:hypothetical protein
VANDDWRVTVTPHDQGHAGRAVQSLREHEVEDDVRRRLGRRVAVSSDDSSVFLYAGTEDAAREADRVVREVMAQREVEADFALDRWHPIEEKWEDASVAMPQTAQQRQEEHQRLEDEETRESMATGVAQWQVRIDLPTHRDAVELAERLRGEGRSVARRWRFLIVGANNEDEADEIARMVEQEAPGAVSVHPEPAGALLPFIPF